MDGSNPKKSKTVKPLRKSTFFSIAIGQFKSWRPVDSNFSRAEPKVHEKFGAWII